MKENKRRVLVMPCGPGGYSFSGSKAYFETRGEFEGTNADGRIGFALKDSLGVVTHIVIDHDKDPEEFRIYVEGGNITIKE